MHHNGNGYRAAVLFLLLQASQTRSKERETTDCSSSPAHTHTHTIETPKSALFTHTKRNLDRGEVPPGAAPQIHSSRIPSTYRACGLDDGRAPSGRRTHRAVMRIALQRSRSSWPARQTPPRLPPARRAAPASMNCDVSPVSMKIDCGHES